VAVVAADHGDEILPALDAAVAARGSDSSDKQWEDDDEGGDWSEFPEHVRSPDSLMSSFVLNNSRLEVLENRGC
jgi:hypothetical protein